MSERPATRLLRKARRPATGADDAAEARAGRQPQENAT
jgi:hypothetical protein